MIIQNEENELKYKNEILNNLKNDNEIKKYENIKTAVMEINKKDPINNKVVRDISEESLDVTEGSGSSTLGINLNDIKFNLKCIIKMIEYAPISGGNVTELNKILDLFLNKKSLLVLKNNDNKCFYTVILGNF